MDYLTVKELAELKGCSLQHLQKQVKIGKIHAEQKLHPQNNKMCYMIPITSLSEELQAKYYKQKRTEAGIMPEKVESEEPVKEPGLKYRSKGTQRSFDSFSAGERETIQFWIDLLNEWQAERSKRKDKTEFDKLFVAHQKYLNANINISPDILYRKYSAYKNECYEELIDKRGGWNKGRSKLADDSIIWQSFLSVYLEQVKPNISLCRRMVCAYIAEKYPELTAEIPSAACFRRKIETLPFAILEYSHKGAKAMHDHCVPYANRSKKAVYANDVWAMDNYTIDVIIKEHENSEKTKRLYITTVLDVKSNVLVDWNITESPDSNTVTVGRRY